MNLCSLLRCRAGSSVVERCYTRMLQAAYTRHIEHGSMAVTSLAILWAVVFIITMVTVINSLQLEVVYSSVPKCHLELSTLPHSWKWVSKSIGYTGNVSSHKGRECTLYSSPSASIDCACYCIYCVVFVSFFVCFSSFGCNMMGNSDCSWLLAASLMNVRFSGDLPWLIVWQIVMFEWHINRRLYLVWKLHVNSVVCHVLVVCLCSVICFYLCIWIYFLVFCRPASVRFGVI